MIKKKIKIVKFKGGLGNQLFQYGLYKYFKSKKFQVYADLSFYENQKKYKKISLRKFYLNKILKEKLHVIKIEKNSNKFILLQKCEKLLIKLLKLNINIPIKYWNGYWQDIFFAKYVNKNDFKKNFFKNFIKLPKKYYILHYRSGDFKYSDSHVVTDSLYYHKALKKFKNYKIIALSDDDKNLNKMLNKILIKKNIIKLKNIDTMNAFKIIVGCSGGISSNSTFCWWGSHLSKKKNWVYPEHWLKAIKTKDANLAISKNKILI